MFWPTLLPYEQVRERQRELLEKAARQQLANTYRPVPRRWAPFRLFSALLRGDWAAKAGT